MAVVLWLSDGLEGVGSLPLPPEDLVTTGVELERMKEELAVGPAVLVELDIGNDAQVVEVVVVVVVRPGQFVAVGLHWVMVTVRVMVWVDVVVESASTSWAATMDRPVARTARMLLNCIVSNL